jgi:hypothetical protein
VWVKPDEYLTLPIRMLSHKLAVIVEHILEFDGFERGERGRLEKLVIHGLWTPFMAE